MTINNNLTNFAKYREILLKKKLVAPHFLWFTPMGKFLRKKRNFRKKIVLDFGSDIESQTYLHFLQQNDGSDRGYFGFDISISAQKWLLKNGYFYDFWKDNSKKFDVINASQVYEHLNEKMREDFIKRSYYLLKEGGVLYIDIPYIANLNLIEFFRRDRTHKVVSCEDEAIYIGQFGFRVELFVGGYTIPYKGLLENIYRVITNLALGYKPFLVTFIIAIKE